MSNDLIRVTSSQGNLLPLVATAVSQWADDWWTEADWQGWAGSARVQLIPLRGATHHGQFDEIESSTDGFQFIVDLSNRPYVEVALQYGRLGLDGSGSIPWEHFLIVRSVDRLRRALDGQEVNDVWFMVSPDTAVFSSKDRFSIVCTRDVAATFAGTSVQPDAALARFREFAVDWDDEAPGIADLSALLKKVVW